MFHFLHCISFFGTVFKGLVTPGIRGLKLLLAAIFRDEQIRSGKFLQSVKYLNHPFLILALFVSFLSEMYQTRYFYRYLLYLSKM